jgi:hypothetical protein
VLTRLRPAGLSGALGAALLVASSGCAAVAPAEPGPSPAPTTSERASASVTRATPGPAPSADTAARQALAVLAALPVKGRAPKTGYSRDQFGPAWTDDTVVAGGHNGCDTRNDILRRDLTGVVVKPNTRGCVVLRGRLADPYTGRVIEFARGERTSIAVQIDHVVALSDAWQTGAQQLSPDERVDLANDPRELLAVDGPTNEAKGDGDAATWLPPRRGFRCAYVARQVMVKRAYRLWVTPAERDAMRRVLQSCPAGR